MDAIYTVAIGGVVTGIALCIAFIIAVIGDLVFAPVHESPPLEVCFFYGIFGLAKVFGGIALLLLCFYTLGEIATELLGL